MGINREGFLLSSRICPVCHIQGGIGIDNSKACFGCNNCKSTFIDPYKVKLRTFVTEIVEDKKEGNVVSSYQLPKHRIQEIDFDVDNPYAEWYNEIHKGKAQRVIPKEKEFSW